ncbi:MAG: hypothetical protein ICV65_01645, partial [Flavisolibacter sp.]|nr:hypothetical protein [Flavisolibacter sp.]
MPIDYNLLSNYFTAKELIPIIGGEILKIKKGKNDQNEDRLLTFEQYLIEQRTGLNYDDQQCPKNISELALKFPSLNNSYITSIYKQIPPSDFVISNLEKLVGLTNFDFFISTSYDRKLEELLELKSEFKPEPIIWNHEKKDPLIINIEN